MERNIAYILSLVEARLKEDGELDDEIPVPSVEAAAKTIILLIDRPELPWETSVGRSVSSMSWNTSLSGHATILMKFMTLWIPS